MRIRYVLSVAALAMFVLSAPLFAAPRVPRVVHSKGGVAEKVWHSKPMTVTADVAEVEPNDDFTTANPAACGDAIRPAAIDVPDDIDWIAFSANAGDVITLGTDADGASPIDDTIIGLFDAAGTQLAVDDDSGPGYYSLISNFVAPATGVYYFGIIAYDAAAVGTYQGFITCQAGLPAPPNDQCAGAIDLPCGVVDLSGTTSGALNDYSPGAGGCTGYSAAGRDVVYRMLASPGDMLNLTYTSTADASIYIISDCGDPIGSCLVGADDTVSGQPESLAYTFSSAGTYYLILDSYGTSTYGDWTLTGSNACGATGVKHTSWGSLKSIYR
jgi:hypothetical protein